MKWIIAAVANARRPNESFFFFLNCSLNVLYKTVCMCVRECAYTYMH